VCRILIIDTDPQVIDVVQRYLQEFDVKMVDGPAALAAYLQDEPAITLVCPQQGLSVIKELAAAGAGTCPSRLCGLTADLTETAVDELYNAGVTDIVWKPLHPVLIQRRLNDILTFQRIYGKERNQASFIVDITDRLEQLNQRARAKVDAIYRDRGLL